MTHVLPMKFMPTAIIQCLSLLDSFYETMFITPISSLMLLLYDANSVLYFVRELSMHTCVHAIYVECLECHVLGMQIFVI